MYADFDSAVNRFSLGTKSKSLEFNPNGSLTLHYNGNHRAQTRKPICCRRRKMKYFIYISAYWSKAEILEDRWTPTGRACGMNRVLA
jgi:hypothetical protein